MERFCPKTSTTLTSSPTRPERAAPRPTTLSVASPRCSSSAYTDTATSGRKERPATRYAKARPTAPDYFLTFARTTRKEKPHPFTTPNIRAAQFKTFLPHRRELKVRRIIKSDGRNILDISYLAAAEQLYHGWAFRQCVICTRNRCSAAAR